MNAKKIMGAVLVALLAAALFVGAGAAAVGAGLGQGEVVFVYQQVQATQYSGAWTNAAGNTIEFVAVDTNGNVSIIGNDIVEGKYTQGSGSDEKSIVVKYATGTVIGFGTITGSNVNYPVIGASYYNLGTDNNGNALSSLTLNVTSPNTITPTGIAVTGADKVTKVFEQMTDAEAYVASKEGTYELRVYYKLGNNFVGTAPTDVVNVILGKDVFTITIVEGADPTVTAVADTVVAGNTVDIVINGLPGATYTIEAKGFTIPAQAAGQTIATSGVQIPNTGKVTVTLTAGKDDGDYTIIVKPKNVDGDQAEVELEIIEGDITAEADKDSYFIGQKVTLSGTSTSASNLYFYIEGTNVKLAQIDVNSVVASDNTWEQEITYKNLQDAVNAQGLNKLDAGTYTIYVSSVDVTTDVIPTIPLTSYGYDEEILKPYTTVSVALKQPFLTAELQTTVVAQDSKLVVTGTAESATEGLMVYIFGNNFFVNDTITVKKDSTYKYEYEVDADDMAAGQYFVVIQHPMYDKMFNLGPSQNDKYTIILNTTGEVTETVADPTNTLFKVNDRQTANAAQALCDALDTQNIDDIYVKATFIVAAPTATMNPVPSEVAKGTKLTVSGTTNMAPGEIITVEMLSTAFAAVPKESVNSASFIALTTKVQDDGTWEVTFDTTGLNIDEYTITATAGQFVSTAKVNVVEAADEPVTPVDPVDPVDPKPVDPQPTEPETPGFGALAALAGLGAVAVLLLRRE